MEAKQILDDATLSAVSGGECDPNGVWYRAVNGTFLPQLEGLAASARESDRALVQRCIDTLRPTCAAGYSGNKAAEVDYLRMMLPMGQFQDKRLAHEVGIILTGVVTVSRS